MRILGSVFMTLGLLLGLGLSAFLLVGGGALGLTWILSVAVAKLGFLASLGLIGAGAVFHRIDRRRENAALMGDSDNDSH